MWILLIALLYFLPTFNAYSNKKRNASSVLIVNLFFGWTVIGWVIAFAMSAGKDAAPTVIVKEKEHLPKTAAEEVAHLFDLKQKGALTEEEFQVKKKKILS
jgi:hypothetical protein